MGIISKRVNCAICEGQELKEVLNLGYVPLAGYFPEVDQSLQPERYPLKLLICEDCKLAQVDNIIDPEHLFRDYRYSSSDSLREHFSKYAALLDNRYSVENKHILEIGSNDGVLMMPLVERGARIVGVEPSDNIGSKAKAKGLDVIHDFFSYDLVKDTKHCDYYDLVLCNNAFAHIPDIRDVVRGISYILKPGGHFIFEVHYFKNLIDENQWDNVYHEHLYYYSITALKSLFDQFDMTIIQCEEIPTHAGSIRVTVSNSLIEYPSDVLKRISYESNDVVGDKALTKFRSCFDHHKTTFTGYVEELSKSYTIAAYGASGRANMFCNILGLSKEHITFVVDESPERSGRFIANMGIPIVTLDELRNSDVDLLIIFAWNYSKVIMEKTQFGDYKYLVAFPDIQLVDKWQDLKGIKFI